MGIRGSGLSSRSTSTAADPGLVRARSHRLGWLLAGAGVSAGVAASVADPSGARSAAAQDWSPFVLVAGLLLIGLVADGEGWFSTAGNRLAGVAGSGWVLFAGAVVLVAVVTALLNLDTSVAFLTPVFVYAARSRRTSGRQSRREDEAPLLYGCLLLANAGSLLLPGSNLTNLIVLGHLHLSGGGFAARMALPWLGAVVVTAAVVAWSGREALSASARGLVRADRPSLGVGAVAVAVATILVLALRSPALPVAVVGVVAIGVSLARRDVRPEQAWETLGAPLLVGLFGLAVALGTAGRAWSGPAELLSHLGTWATAGLAAGVAVLVNNLPAASLLAARAPHHPFSLLVGLNLGPNLFVTGSLAWILWWRAARSAGARPSIARASRLGAVAVPLSMAVALGALALSPAPH